MPSCGTLEQRTAASWVSCVRRSENGRVPLKRERDAQYESLFGFFFCFFSAFTLGGVSGTLDFNLRMTIKSFL